MADGPQTRWRRIETLFNQASDLDPSSRGAFLEGACEGDLEMRAELESLLSSSEQTLGALKGSVAAAAGALLEGEREDLARIGPYRLIRMLGEGGMGTVYLGARDDEQYYRLVAIKVLRDSLSSRRELQLLFRRERQILADFDHPNIARMLDGGLTPKGSPYLVMEYIDGTPLDVFCTQRALTLDQRLRLFRALCAAVDYAHRHLVIHRDIKPLNVLVTADGSPKLLDFGIAKLIDPFQTNTAQTTLRGERMLTPDYASPEQLLGKRVSTATDVYALGVLLFELLTGQLPFPGSRTDPTAQSRAICELPPELPSAACLRTRHLPRADALKMRGDIDSILLKALQKKPVHRYASASELLVELDRYLNGLAVDAVVPSVRYRVGKFIGRNRVGTGITLLVALVILAFGLTMGIAARRAARREALARREQEFLASIFKTAAGAGANRESLTARQMLDQASGRLDTELSSDPQLQAEMTGKIGESYMALGLYDKAQPLLERAALLARRANGEDVPLDAQLLRDLATDYRMQANYQQAEPLFRQLLAYSESADGAGSLSYARNLSELGEVLHAEEKDAEAERLLRQAMAIERGAGDPSIASVRGSLAQLLERRGAYSEAVALLLENTEAAERVRGKDSPEYLAGLHSLAQAQLAQGNLEGALKSEREVLATRQKSGAGDQPQTADSLNILALALLEQGRWREAEPLLRQNLEIARNLSEPSGTRYFNALSTWGRCLQQKGDLAGAGDAFDLAQKTLAAQGGGASWNAARLLEYQSLLQTDRGQYPEAGELATQALDLETSLAGPAGPRQSGAQLALGLANLLAGHAAAAESSFRAALESRQALLTKAHPDLLLAQVRLAQALLSEDRPQQALDLLQPARAAAEDAPFPLPAWRLAELRVTEALALRATGHTREADAWFAANAEALKEYPDAAIRRTLLAAIKAPPHSPKPD